LQSAEKEYVKLTVGTNTSSQPVSIRNV